jgi:hypothetical protein
VTRAIAATQQLVSFCDAINNPGLGSRRSRSLCQTRTIRENPVFLIMGPPPDTLAIPMDLPNPMKRHATDSAAAVVEFERKMVILREMKCRKGDQDNPVFDPVVISDLEIGIGEGLVPLDAVEQFLNRLHPCLSPLIARPHFYLTAPGTELPSML